MWLVYNSKFITVANTLDLGVSKVKSTNWTHKPNIM